jgi:hypothetical protein
MYFGSQMGADLDQLAWNLCDCNDETQARECGTPTVEKLEIQKPSTEFMVEADVLFGGQNLELIERVISEYFDDFEYYIRGTILEYKSRTGDQPGILGDFEENEFEVIELRK